MNQTQILPFNAASSSLGCVEEYYRNLVQAGQGGAGAFCEKVQEWYALQQEALQEELSSGVDAAAVECNIARLGRLLQLDKEEYALVRLMILRETVELLNVFIQYCAGIDRDKLDYFQLLALLTGLNYPAVIKRAGLSGSLARMGLFANRLFTSSEMLRKDFFEHSELTQTITNYIETSFACDMDYRDALAGGRCTPRLPSSAFSHLQKEASVIQQLLQSVTTAENRERGINILLYGMPGTGKTEFLKTIAEAAGVTLYAAGRNPMRDEEPGRDERLAHLKMLNGLLGGEKACALLFDEMEDITKLKYAQSAAHSKVYQNAIVEQNPIPVLWATNNIEDVDPAFLRRMTIAFEIKPPSRKARMAIWQSLSKRHGLDNLLDKDALGKLASYAPTTPAAIENAVCLAAKTDGSVEMIKTALDATAALLGQQERTLDNSVDVGFSPAVLNEEARKLIQHAECSGENNAGDFSILLYGPSGTGKSMFAKHLAEKMDREVHSYRASDILSPYVGGTEANIALAFRKASQEQAFLLFDEVDSFLVSREKASTAYDVQAVNEMLCCMESHQHPFACTTNRPEALDNAAMRRFTFKMLMPSLGEEELRECFRHYFAMQAPREVYRLRGITAGDFAAVKKKARFMDCIPDASQLLAMLEEECAHKHRNHAPMGFLAGEY